MTLTAARRPAADSRTALTAQLPWELSDLLRLVAVNAAVVIGVLVAWSGTSGTAVLSEAVSWTVVGIGAIIVQGCGNVGWLLRGRRAVGQRRARLLQDLELLPELAAAADGAPTTAALPVGAIPSQSTPGQDELVAVEGTTRFHRSGCQLVEGKPVVAASSRQHQAASRVPCGVCEP